MPFTLGHKHRFILDTPLMKLFEVRTFHLFLGNSFDIHPKLVSPRCFSSLVNDYYFLPRIFFFTLYLIQLFLGGSSFLKIVEFLSSSKLLSRFSSVSGFKCNFLLFRTRRYEVISPSTYATRIRTYGQSSGAACFDQHSDEKPKIEMKMKLNCAPDGSVMLANGFPESNCNNNLLVLDWDMFE